MFASKIFGGFAQYGVIAGRLVMSHSPPVHSAGRGIGLPKARHHVAIPAFRIGIFLVHEGDSTQSALERRHEIVIGKIAFQPDAFLSLAVEQKHGRRPHGVETMEPSRMLLDVRFDGQEILLDEISSLLVLVRLGIQPSTGASDRGCTEVQQNGAALLVSCDKRLVDVPAPIYSHNSPPGVSYKL